MKKMNVAFSRRAAIRFHPGKMLSRTEGGRPCEGVGVLVVGVSAALLPGPLPTSGL